MGMVIYNNIAAMSILNENNRNLRKANKASTQLALGEKITNAGDDASGYSISEKMKIKIRALDQCNANSSKGKSMIDLASEAVDQQVDVLKQLKTVALRATDGTYTDIDRQTLQKEVGQMLDQCDDIANQTTFNGIHLLNQSTVSRADFWFDSDAPYKPNQNVNVLTYPNGNTTYTVPQKDYKTILTPATNIYNTSFPQQGAAYTVLPTAGSYAWDSGSNSVQRITTNGSGDLEFANGNPVWVNGQTNPSGTTPSTTTAYMVDYPSYASLNMMPSLGDRVADQQTAPPNGPNTYEVVTAPGSGSLAYAYTPSSVSIMELDFSQLTSQVSSTEDFDGKGFSVNCSGCSQFVSIIFDGKETASKLYEGSSGSPKPLAYVIGIKDLDMTNVSDSLAQLIFNGISAANGVSGSAVLPSSSDESALITSDHSITMHYYSNTGKFTISKNGPSMTYMNGVRGAMVEEDFFLPEQTKVLQTDVKGSQHTNVKLPNTTVEALFPTKSSRWDTDIKETDYPESWPKGYDLLTLEEKRQKWAEEVWPYALKADSLDFDTCVSTMDKANVFLYQVDQALKYLLGANTTLGAESARLNFTMDNLTTRSENETNCESVMRDTDIAKSYTDYMKHNVLAQASQSMLAQANQNSNSVLSLLQ